MTPQSQGQTVADKDLGFHRVGEVIALGIIALLIIVDSWYQAEQLSVAMRMLSGFAAVSAMLAWLATRRRNLNLLKVAIVSCLLLAVAAGVLMARGAPTGFNLIAMAAAALGLTLCLVVRQLALIRALGALLLLIACLAIFATSAQAVPANALGFAEIAAYSLLGFSLLMHFDVEDIGHRTVRFCADGMMVIGLAVIIGWLLGVSAIVQGGGSQWVPMQFNAAICMLLAGISLLFLSHGQTARALLLLLPVAVLSLTTLAEEYAGLHFGLSDFFILHTMKAEGVTPGRMAPNAAIAFLSGVLAHVLAPRRANASLARWSPSWACGFVVMIIAAIVITGYAMNIPSVRGWGLRAPMGLLTSIGFACYGIGLGFLGMGGESGRNRRAVWLPMLVAIATVVVSTLVWYSVERSLEQQSQQELHRNLISLTRTIEESRNIRLQAIERLRKRLESDSKLQAALFDLDARIYLKDFPSLRSITWLDQDRHIRQIVTQADMPALAGQDCLRDRACQALLKAVSGKATRQFSDPYWLADGDLGQWLAMAVTPANGEQSFLLVQLDYSLLLQRTLDNALPDSPLRVSFDGQALYERNIPSEAAVESIHYPVEQAALRLDIWLAPGANNARLPNMLLIFGLLIGGLLAMALRLAALARQRAASAEIAEQNARRSLLEREQTQQALAEKEKQLGSLIEDMADGFMMLDTQWNFVYLNHRAEVILRRSREELIGSNCWDEFPEAVDNPMYAAYQTAVEKNVAVSLETFYAPLDCWLEIRAHPHAKGLAVYFQDISARKLNAEKLQHSETLLKLAGQVAHIGGWSVELGAERVLWSEEVCAIHGMPLGYVPSLAEAINFYAPGSRERIAKVFADCARAGAPFDEEMQIINSQGDLVWVRAIGQAVRDGQGAIVGVNGAFQEIDERKRNEQLIEKERLLLKTLLENLSEGIVACDAEGRLSLFNRATREFHGLPEAALSPEQWSQYYSLYLPDGETLMSVEQVPLFRALRGESVRDVEMLIKPLDRPARLVACTGELIKDASGQLLGAVVVMHDITQRRQSELNLARSSRALLMTTACNEAIIRAEEEAALLEAVCNIAVSMGGYRMVWVGFAQHDADRSIKIVAQAGAGLDYLKDLKLSWSENSPVGLGPAGRTVRSGTPVIVEDIAQEPSFGPWAEAARKRGYRGLVCLPLRQDSQVIGILNLYAGEVRPITDDEVSLLQDLADDLAFGLSNLRARQERQRLEAAMLKVATAVSASVGDAFFEQLCRNMADALGAHAAFVSRLLPGEPLAARTISAVVNRKVIENFGYVVAGTPCEHLTGNPECLFSERVAELFPRSPSLAALGAQAYVGRRLDSSSGEPLGMLFVLFRDPLLHSEMVVSTLRIFAARAAAEIERQQSDERLRERDRFFDMSLEVFVIFNPETQRWLQVNPVLSRITGYSQEELCGRDFKDFLHPDDRAAADERALRLSGEGEVVNSFIDRYICRDGSQRWFEWVSVPAPGGLVYGVGRDITERRKSEIALQQSLVDLDNRNRELQDFAFVASHDLQEPLRKIRAFSDRLSTRYRDSLATQARDYLDRMNQAATRMQVLIDDLLAYSRIATGGKPFTQVNLATICAEVLNDLDARIDATVAHISVANLPTITADATQMRQLFQNLLSNALKFHSPRRRPYLGITCAAIILNERPGFRLEFIDNGVGFEAKYAERIFTPFQRLHSRSEYEGTGIGLAIVRRIVERHHGSIEAFGELDIGSRFVVFIPSTQPNNEP